MILFLSNTDRYLSVRGSKKDMKLREERREHKRGWDPIDMGLRIARLDRARSLPASTANERCMWVSTAN